MESIHVDDEDDIWRLPKLHYDLMVPEDKFYTDVFKRPRRFKSKPCAHCGRKTNWVIDTNKTLPEKYRFSCSVLCTHYIHQSHNPIVIGKVVRFLRDTEWRLLKINDGTFKVKNPYDIVFSLCQKLSQTKRCTYCQCDLSKLPSSKITFDHIVPLMISGMEGIYPSNIVIACLRCNQEKGHVENALRKTIGLSFSPSHTGQS